VLNGFSERENVNEVMTSIMFEKIDGHQGGNNAHHVTDVSAETSRLDIAEPPDTSRRLS
jgi:hypothetical protein